LNTTQSGFNYRVLVVDDEVNILATCSAILSQKGYEVRTAEDGFVALVELRRSLPDVIISDLRMPNMNGFEFLSVVRQRFPQISVIAISGEFVGSAPQGLLVDAFLNKGDYSPEELCQEISRLLERAPLRAAVARPDKAPTWVPKNDTGYIIVTCPQCLRSFSIQYGRSDAPQSTECTFCTSTVVYVVDARTTGSPASSRQRKSA
jgi:CheY-like chemotaxis protein